MYIYIYIYICIMYIYIYIYQEIIQTKMEGGIRFWVPNLGLSPKYGNMVKLLFRNKELKVARKLNFGKKIIVLKNKIYSKIVYISIYSQIMIYSKIRGEGLTAPPSPLPQRKPPAAKFASQSDAHVKTDAEIKFLYYPLYIYIYRGYIYIYI